MISIASLNLNSNIQMQQQSELDVLTLKQAYDRMSAISYNQLLMRVLVNIANGYEPENSNLLNDRYNLYHKL